MSQQDKYTFHKLHQPTIDEERWLLHVISNRQTTNDKEEYTKASSQPPSPTSFLEAIGESATTQNNADTYTPNPLNCVSHSRTQLWKPSRSWWEAKSGRNPWIEPRLHSRRWRFLWPLIRYHKFLARCIKKLKRFGVGYNDGGDLPKFLRQEVVSISNHLARLSEFTSEEWTEGLTEFHSWYYCKDCDFAEFYHFSPVVPSHGSFSRGGVFERLSSRQQYEGSSKQMGFHEQLLLSREEGSLFPPRSNNDISDKNYHKKDHRSSNVHTNEHCTPTRTPRRNKKNFTPPSSTKHRRNHHSNRYHYPSYYDDYGRVVYPSADGYPYALPPPPYYHPHAHASSPNPFMHPTFGSMYHTNAHAHMYRDEFWTSSSHFQGPPQFPPPHSGVVNNNSVYYTSLDDSFDQKNWGHLDPMQALASPTRSLHNYSYVNNANESVSDVDDAENKGDKEESNQENADVTATPRRNKK